MGFHGVGVDCQGLLVMCHSLVFSIAIRQQETKVSVGHPTSGVLPDDRPIQGLGIGIHPALPPGQHAQHEQCCHAKHNLPVSLEHIQSRHYCCSQNNRAYTGKILKMVRNK